MSRPSLLASLVLFGMSVGFVPLASALPLYATRQGQACATCHFDPQGGGPRNDFGFQFEKNRHALTPETGKWADLVLANNCLLYTSPSPRDS